MYIVVIRVGNATIPVSPAGSHRKHLRLLTHAPDTGRKAGPHEQIPTGEHIAPVTQGAAATHGAPTAIWRKAEYDALSNMECNSDREVHHSSLTLE